MRIHATEQELLVPEIRKFSRGLLDPEARARYGNLLAAVEEGEVGDDLTGYLSIVLEISLQSGRLRKLYGADGEQALARLFQRTPAGAALSDAAKNVSEALSG